MDGCSRVKESQWEMISDIAPQTKWLLAIARISLSQSSSAVSCRLHLTNLRKDTFDYGTSFDGNGKEIKAGQSPYWRVLKLRQRKYLWSYEGKALIMFFDVTDAKGLNYWNFRLIYQKDIRSSILFVCIPQTLNEVSLTSKCFVRAEESYIFRRVQVNYEISIQKKRGIRLYQWKSMMFDRQTFEDRLQLNLGKFLFRQPITVKR